MENCHKKMYGDVVDTLCHMIIVAFVWLLRELREVLSVELVVKKRSWVTVVTFDSVAE